MIITICLSLFEEYILNLSASKQQKLLYILYISRYIPHKNVHLAFILYVYIHCKWLTPYWPYICIRQPWSWVLWNVADGLMYLNLKVTSLLYTGLQCDVHCSGCGGVTWGPLDGSQCCDCRPSSTGPWTCTAQSSCSQFRYRCSCGGPRYNQRAGGLYCVHYSFLGARTKTSWCKRWFHYLSRRAYIPVMWLPCSEAWHRRPSAQWRVDSRVCARICILPGNWLPRNASHIQTENNHRYHLGVGTI
jgi:hypothetical protein